MVRIDNKSSGQKPIWSWDAGKANDVYDLLLQFRPYMGIRRKAKLDEALEVLMNKSKVRKFYE